MAAAKGGFVGEDPEFVEEGPEPPEHGHNGRRLGFWAIFWGIVSAAPALVQLVIAGWRGWFQLLLVVGLGVFGAKLAVAWRRQPPPPNLRDHAKWFRSRISQDRVVLVALGVVIVSGWFVILSVWPRIGLSLSPRSPSEAEEVRIRACAKGVDPNLPRHLRVQVNTAKDGSEHGTWETIAELPVGCVQGEDAPRWATLEHEDGPHLIRVQAPLQTEAWETGLSSKVTYELLPRRPPPAKQTSPSGTIRSATGKVDFRWEPALRAKQYQVRVYRGADRTLPPILDQRFSSGTHSFSHEFRADEPELYWTVTAINDRGSNESSSVRFAVDRKEALKEGLLDDSDAPPGWSPAPVPDSSSFEDANYCGISPNLDGLEVEVRVAFQSLPPEVSPVAGERIGHGLGVFKPGGAKAFMDGVDDAQSRCRRTVRIVRGVRLVGTVDRRMPPRAVRDQADQALAFTEQVKSELGTTVNGEVIYARKGDLVYILAVIASGADGLVPLSNRPLADSLATRAIEKLKRIP